MKKNITVLLALQLLLIPTLKASTEVDALFAKDSEVALRVSEQISKHKRDLVKLRTLMSEIESSITGDHLGIGRVSEAVLGGSFIAQTFRYSQNIQLGNVEAAQKGLAGLSLTRLLIAVLAASTADEAKMKEYYDSLFSARVQIQILIHNSTNQTEISALQSLIDSIDELKASIETTDRSAISDMGNAFIWTDVLGGMLFKNKVLLDKILQAGAGALVMADFIQTLEADKKETILQKITEIKTAIDTQIKTLN